MTIDWYQIARKNIEHPLAERFVEMDVQRLIIEPLLQWLGYDTFDFNIVQEQTRISHSGQKAGQGRADYTIYNRNKLVMIIEAKMLSESLEDADKLKQLLDYCNYHPHKPRWGVLTNGKYWHIYDSYAEGSAPKRCVLKLDVSQNPKSLYCLKYDNITFLNQYGDKIRDLVNVPDSTRNEIITMLQRSFIQNLDSTPSKQSKVRRKNSANVKRESLDVIASYDVKPQAGQKPSKLCIAEKTTSVEHWSEILIQVSKHIISHTTSSSFSTWSPGKGKVRISAKSTDLRSPTSIGKGLFIETNLSSRDIVRTLNAMIDTAEMPRNLYWVK